MNLKKRLDIEVPLNGCRDSIVLWGNIIIDGYNRFDICTKLSTSNN